mmetsp:Transcript_12363/g.24611  ORF Transcript_12363/g.24611 Transcript_12363/m.24611 type:complete len:318 (+) Transcript_12363:1098-2051(+)
MRWLDQDAEEHEKHDREDGDNGECVHDEETEVERMAEDASRERVGHGEVVQTHLQHGDEEVDVDNNIEHLWDLQYAVQLLVAGARVWAKLALGHAVGVRRHPRNDVDENCRRDRHQHLDDDEFPLREDSALRLCTPEKLLDHVIKVCPPHHLLLALGRDLEVVILLLIPLVHEHLCHVHRGQFLLQLHLAVVLQGVISSREAQARAHECCQHRNPDRQPHNSNDQSVIEWVHKRHADLIGLRICCEDARQSLHRLEAQQRHGWDGFCLLRGRVILQSVEQNCSHLNQSLLEQRRLGICVRRAEGGSKARVGRVFDWR